MPLKIKFSDVKGYSIKGLTQEQLEVILALLDHVSTYSPLGKNNIYEDAAESLVYGFDKYKDVINGNAIKVVTYPGIIYVRQE